MAETNTLKRTLGLPGAMILGLGSMLGTGVFVALGLAAGHSGQLVWVAVLIGGLLAILNGFSSARLAAAHPVSGGTYEYGHRELQPWAGVLCGWLFLVAKSASAATASIGIASYLFPDQLVGPGRILLLAPLLVAAAISMIGLRPAMWLTAILLLVAGIGLTGFVWLGFGADGMTDVDTARASMDADFADLLLAGGLVFVAFTGYGRIATLGEEIHDPARSIPIAVALTVGLSAIVYALVAMAGVRLVGGTAFGMYADTDQGPLAMIAKEAGSPGLATMLRIGAVCAIGSVLLNLVLGLSRVVLAMGRRHDMPGTSARIVHGQPMVAIVMVTVAVGVIAMLGSVKAAWTGSAAAVLIYYAFTNAASFRMCLRGHRRVAAAIASLAGMIGCVTVAMALPAEAWLPVGIAVACGIILTLLSRIMTHQSGETPG